MCILKKHKLELKVVSVNYVAFICKLRHFVTITLCIYNDYVKIKAIK